MAYSTDRYSQMKYARCGDLSQNVSHQELR